MKILKSIFVTLLFISVVSCGDNDEPTIPFSLNAESLAGSYNMSALTKDIVTTTVVSNQVVKISDEKIVGDIFELNFILNADGTYTVEGNYTVESELKPVGSSATTTKDIIPFFTDAGSFTINVLERKIAFISSGDEFLNGTLSITAFNETLFTLNQETVTIEGSNTFTTNATYTFTRK